MKRVLVTGATGFIGRRCVARLADKPDIEVIAVSRTSGKAIAPHVRHLAVDLLNASDADRMIETERPTHLLHLAWDVTPGSYWNSLNNLFWLAASVRLFARFASCGGRRAVFAGTCAEYDWSQGGILSETSSPLKPQMLYGAAKDALRRSVEAAATALGVSVAWGRIFWTYGPGEPTNRLVSDVAKALVEGRSAEVGLGLQRRDFVHVDDVAGAFVAALNTDLASVFNIGSGKAVSVRALVEQLAEITGRGDLVRFGARAPPIGEPDAILADIGRLTDEISYTPTIGLAEGLADTVRWWRRHCERHD